CRQRDALRARARRQPPLEGVMSEGSMLTSLLPGIRELRAPLAAGYLWLAAVWILFAHDVPARHDADGAWADAYRFVDAASVFGLAAAISFAAYLIGTLSVA